MACAVVTPIDGDYIYGLCSYGQLRLKAASAVKRGGTEQRWASGRSCGRGSLFISNDRGDLIIARMTPAGWGDQSHGAFPPTSSGTAARVAGRIPPTTAGSTRAMTRFCAHAAAPGPLPRRLR